MVIIFYKLDQFVKVKDHKTVRNDISRTHPQRPQQRQQEPLHKPVCLFFHPPLTHFLLFRILDQNRHSTNG